MLKIDSDIRTHAADLLQFIDESPSPRHGVASLRERLLACDFLELDESQPWTLEAGVAYFVVRDGSLIVAFSNGDNALSEKAFRILNLSNFVRKPKYPGNNTAIEAIYPVVAPSVRSLRPSWEFDR